MVTDSGPQFLSREFRNFTTEWAIQHATSSPEHHQSNGKAEAAVKITKTMMCKALRDGTDQFETLLELRNTSRQDTGLRPGEMMFSKKYPITTTVCRSADFPLRVTTTEVSET